MLIAKLEPTFSNKFTITFVTYRGRILCLIAAYGYRFVRNSYVLKDISVDRIIE